MLTCRSACFKQTVSHMAVTGARVLLFTGCLNIGGWSCQQLLYINNDMLHVV